MAWEKIGVADMLHPRHGLSPPFFTFSTYFGEAVYEPFSLARVCFRADMFFLLRHRSSAFLLWRADALCIAIDR
jgi:hypothetical protein